MYYQRNDYDPRRGNFRVKGDTIEIIPAYEEFAIRIQFFGDEIEKIEQLDILTGEILSNENEILLADLGLETDNELQLRKILRRLKKNSGPIMIIVKIKTKKIVSQRITHKPIIIKKRFMDSI